MQRYGFSMVTPPTSLQLPECFGLQWDPTTLECPQCAAEPECRLKFATDGLDAAALKLGQSAQEAPAEKLAQIREVSREAIDRARVLRFSLRRGETPAARPVLAQAPSLPPPAESQEPASEPRPEPSQGSPKKRRGRPPKPKAAPEPATTDEITPDTESGAEPEQSGVGFVLNLTTGEMEHADWPKFPPLFRTPGDSAPILQVVFWSAPLARWVWLVSEPTGRQIPEGVVELSWPKLIHAGLQQRLGSTADAALRSALGL